MKKLLLIILLLCIPLTIALACEDPTNICPRPSKIRLNNNNLTVRDSDWEIAGYRLDNVTVNNMEFVEVAYLEWAEGYDMFCIYYAENADHDWGFISLQRKSLIESLTLSQYWHKEKGVGYCNQSREVCDW